MKAPNILHSKLEASRSVHTSDYGKQSTDLCLLQSFVADVLISQTWTDHRLNYPDDVLLNHSMLSLDWFDEIWHPYVYVSNAKTIKLQVIPVPNRILSFGRDKAITHHLRLSLELTCVMNFALYPHDRHECKIQLESRKLVQCVHLPIGL